MFYIRCHVALFKMAKISKLKPKEFTGDEINDCIYVDYEKGSTKSIVKMSTIFDWIKTEANKNGLTVKMTNERIMFISGNAT